NAPILPSTPDIHADLSVHTTSGDDVQCQILRHVAVQTQMMTRFKGLTNIVQQLTNLAQ
ncbi:hypothetical protein U1Q18_009421, partial [Sarracenia purpurea var. burkii]